MSQFKANPIDFSAACAMEGGQCTVARENVIFLDEGTEYAAVDALQMKCGYVIIIPDAANAQQALLYYTSCQRMADVVSQVFREDLQAPKSIPQKASDMSLGELQRRAVAISYDDCKTRVASFDF